MNSFIQGLNQWSANVPGLAWQMFWQSSLLVVVVFVADFALRRRIRAAVRYALWLVVLMKLILPPALALPTGLAWWLRPGAPANIPSANRKVVISYPVSASATRPWPIPAQAPPAQPRISASAIGVAGSAGASLSLLCWLISRWVRVARDVRRAEEPPEALLRALDDARDLVGLDKRVRLRVTHQNMSPAVCGLMRPIILLPEGLVRNLPQNQMRAVLIHELIHLKRRDVWMNCLQTLLQIIYWWHPLAWFANARIHRAREEAVDDAVMLALNDEAECYAPTLLEVAKLAFHRPLASLGLVGILESRSALRQRIERLVDFSKPRKTGLSVISILGIATFAALAVPMGQAPERVGAAAVETNTDRIANLVQDGKLLLELSRLDEADAKFQMVLKLDPANPAALFYFSLVQKMRFGNWGGTNRVGRADLNGAYHRTNLVYISSGIQEIRNKLFRIRLERVQFDGVPLSEVIRKLNEEVKYADPENRGINFIINQSHAHTTGTIDPSTGLPIPSAASPPDATDDIDRVRITIHPPLSNLRVADALDAIVKTAEKPIQYLIQDEAVAFSAKSGSEPQALYTRIMRVDPNTFIQGLQSVLDNGFEPIQPSGGGVHAAARTNDTATLQLMVNQFFGSLGVDMTPPKMAYFNEGEGTLMLHGTLQDLDTIEQAVEVLNITPPQVNIRAKFIEMPSELADALWVGWGVTNDSVMRASVSTVLAPGQARQLLDELGGKSDTETSAASVTTLSGRQTEIQVVEQTNVVIEVTNGVFETTNVSFGLILDVLPYVSWDGQKIQLTVVPTVTEFIGYDSPPPYSTGLAQASSPAQPLPRFRLKRVTTSTSVPDGYTLVLGRPTQSEIVTQNGVATTNQVPDDPKRNLMILVTPTIIDAAGNRVHDGKDANPKQK